jgi:BirA family biotin operon repressor/biotin-[acetyl-CoA-carboxylase] ligase
VNLYASVLLEGALRLEEIGPLSFIGSLATSDAIRDLGLTPAIKWPNDVMLDRQKVAGRPPRMGAARAGG